VIHRVKKAERTTLHNKIGLLRDAIQKSQNLPEDLFRTITLLVSNKENQLKIPKENVSRSVLYMLSYAGKEFIIIMLNLSEKVECNTSLQICKKKICFSCQYDIAKW